MYWPTVSFTHQYIGQLTIDNGIDAMQWAYNMNTAVFPTYGGEVVQILSTYVDNVTIQGTVATYRQMEQIYRYFSRYLQVATQGTNQNKSKNSVDNTSGGAYNLQPIHFSYPRRGWTMKIFPIDVPGFHLGTDVVGPTWEVTAFVLDDDSQELAQIKEGIKALVTTGGIPANESQPGGTVGSGVASLDINSFSITGNISPLSGNPNTDPWQTFDEGTTAAKKDISTLGSYYGSLIPSYNDNDFSSLTGIYGSKPNFGETKNQSNKTNNQNKKGSRTEKPPKNKKNS